MKSISVNNWKRWHSECIATWRPSYATPVVLACCRPNLQCACAESAISELPVKVLAPLLDSTTPIFLQGTNIVGDPWPLTSTDGNIIHSLCDEIAIARLRS